jgi:hypothetical protein
MIAACRNVLFVLLAFCASGPAVAQVKFLDVTNVIDGTYMVTRSGDTFEFTRVNVLQPITTGSTFGRAATKPQVQQVAVQERSASVSQEQPVTDRSAAARQVGDSAVCRNVAVAYSVVLLQAKAGNYSSLEQIDTARRAAQNVVLGSDVIRPAWAGWSKDTDIWFASLVKRRVSVPEYTTSLLKMRDDMRTASNNDRLVQLNAKDVLPIVQDLYPRKMSEQLEMVSKIIDDFKV